MKQVKYNHYGLIMSHCIMGHFHMLEGKDYKSEFSNIYVLDAPISFIFRGLQFEASYDTRLYKSNLVIHLPTKEIEVKKIYG